MALVGWAVGGGGDEDYCLRYDRSFFMTIQQTRKQDRLLVGKLLSCACAHFGESKLGKLAEVNATKCSSSTLQGTDSNTQNLVALHLHTKKDLIIIFDTHSCCTYSWPGKRLEITPPAARPVCLNFEVKVVELCHGAVYFSCCIGHRFFQSF